MRLFALLVFISGMAACFQAVTVTRKPIKVMIVDTGIEPIDAVKDYLANNQSKREITDTHGHGTHVTGLVLYGPQLNDPLCKEVKIYSCRFYGEASHDTSYCFRKATALKVNFVNLSGGGLEYSMDEEAAIRNSKATFIVAAGNEDSDITKNPYYPASLNLPNMRIVGNGTSERTKTSQSNYGLPNIVWRNGENIISFSNKGKFKTMSGTSQATAIYTHELLQKECQRLHSNK